MAIDETTPEFEACCCSKATIMSHQQILSKGKLTADELKSVTK